MPSDAGALCCLSACADVSVQYGINATQLLSTAARIQWAAAGHLIWNFPLASSAEATGVPTPASTLLGDCDEANKQLMGRFLMSAARLLLCFNPHIKVGPQLQQPACCGTGAHGERLCWKL